MPNLKEKIEAQLKGVKKEELKDYLSRTGYAHQKAVAKANKTEYSKTSNKNLSSKKFVLIGLLIGIIFVLWLLAMPFFSTQQENIDEFNVPEIEDSSVIQPIDTFTGENGEIVEVYSGIIRQLSSTSITLVDGNKGKTFTLSEENSVEYIMGTGPNKGEFVETPQIGNKVTILLLLPSSAERPYIHRVIIEGS
jgi:hypothetical protein